MKIRESDGLLSISGTYDEMRSLVPPLKSLGFKWDGQVWSIPVSALTPAKRERVDAMTSGPLRAQQEMVQKVQDSWAHVKEDMSKLFSLAFEEKPKGILITGIPRDMDHIVKRVGGAGLENGYFISWSGVRDTKALDQFWENLKDLSQRGGDWVVLDGDYVWYVTNNGSDGDDWSLNNVETGGAGAIGRRLRLTPEIQEIIALAS